MKEQQFNLLADDFQLNLKATSLPINFNMPRTKTITYDWEDTDFDFEINYIELEFALIDIIEKEFEVTKADEKARKLVRAIVEDWDMIDELHEMYQDEVYEYFEDEARELYNDMRC